MAPLVEGGDVVEGLGERVLGRVVAADVHEAGQASRCWCRPGTLLDEGLVRLLEQEGVDQIQVRSPITCETRYGVCASCYGRDLARGRLINIGEAVGVIAAQSIGEPGTQLTMRTFHIGGAASRAAAASNVEIRNKGTLRFHHIKTVEHEKGHLVAVSRSGEIGVVDEFGRERERYKIPYGATITAKEGTKVASGQIVATWDPHTHPVVTEVAGFIKFQDFVDGLTVTTQLDEVTGLSSTVVLDSKQRRRQGPAADDQAAEREGQGSDVREHDDPGGVHAAVRARWSTSRTARRCRSATSSPASRRSRRRPATSPAVCRASPTCSRRASPRTRRSSRRRAARSASARRPRASAPGHHRR